MLVFHSPLSLTHDPPYEILSGCAQPYFESPQRYHRILAALLASPAFEERRLDWRTDEVVTAELLRAVRAVHDEEYLAFLEEIYDEWIAEGGSKDAALPETFLRQDLLLQPSDGTEGRGSAIARIGRYSFDLSAPVTADTWTAALASTRVALTALEALTAADAAHQATFALCRPPGHHATDALCGGYCYLNSAAIAARHFQSQRAIQAGQGASRPRVAILDIDYHHGNGTSKIFWNDASVLYCSLHGSPDYPYYTGAASELGGPDARGLNVNYPLPLGTDDAAYLHALTQAVQRVNEFEPELLVVSLGVDTFRDDPLTQFDLSLEAYPEMGRVIGAMGVQTLFVMEGGYCLDAIGECVRGVLEGFETGAADLVARQSQ
ncbi:histone deacetylase family protein [Rhodotorula paludigena]|uniref:histone deacetylase family protein n=1 Tax=Rhodotorula paludigena TaxID=86838 RepID=UPI00316F0449